MLLNFTSAIYYFISDIFEVLSFEINFSDAISVPFIDIVICFVIVTMVGNVFWKGAQG